MQQDTLIAAVQDCVRGWTLDKFGKNPFLLEFSRCKREIILQDFTYEIWYESKILGVFLVFTTKREMILRFLNNKFSGRLLSFEILKNLEEVLFSVFKDLVKDLDKSFLVSLEKIYVGFDIKDKKFLRSKGLIKFLWGTMSSYFNFRINGIGELSLCLTGGPKEFLKSPIPRFQ